MKTKLLPLFLAVTLFNSGFSQVNEKKRANFWHFGNQAAIDFTCVPASFTGSQMNAFEGSASISDTNGILQFYTEGTTVWDRNNNVMPNGTGLLGHYSSVQPAVITPHPGNPDHYFIFTTDAIWENNGVNGLQWHEVDMNLNGGFGDVISKNNQLIDRVQEKLVAVRNASSTGYWIVIQKSNPTSTSSSNVGTNIYHAYEVTAAGVNPTPVISSTGPNVSWQSYGMFMSPTGDVMVNIHPDLNVYDFNNATGTLTHRWAASLSPFLGYFEFSPDGNLLYGCRSSEIYQMDLNAANVGAFQASQTLVSTTGVDMKAIQLAPDCKLYGLSTNGTVLHSIDNPNTPGVGCGFTQNAITLNSGSGSHCLTNFCSSFFEFPCGNRLDFDLTGVDASCMNDGTASIINLTGTAPFTFSWSTGDTTQSISNLGGGMYYVSVSDASGCVINDSIKINQPQTTNIDNAIITNLTTCTSNDGAIDITTSIGGTGKLDTLLWDSFETDGHPSRYTANPYPGNASSSFFFKRDDDAGFNFSNDPTNEDGTFYFGARRTGFSSLPTLCNVTFNPTSIAGYSNLEMCAYLALGRNNMSVDANTRITLEYNIDGTGWNTLMDFRQPAPNPFPGNNLSEDTDGNGVGDGVSLNTAFQDFCYPIPGTGNNIELRITTNASGSSLRQTAFDNIRLKATPPYTYTYLWSTGDTTQDISNLAAGTYWVQITGSNGCIVTDTFTVTSPCTVPLLNASFNPSSLTICEGDSITFTDNSTGNNISVWNWTFNGGSPGSANTQGPHTIGFNTSGNYNIVLQVTDSSGTDDTTIAIIVLPKANSTANTSICAGDSILLGGSYQTTAGTYNDTIFNGAVNGCDSIVTTTLTISPSDTAAFTYPSGSYCLADPDPLPTITGTSGGTFSINNSGLINSNTGLINITGSGVGAYVVTYITNGSCPDTATFNINIVTSTNATITQAGPFCENDSSVTLTAVDPGGNWTGTGIINATNGTFDPSTAGAGNHLITYTISGSCGDVDTMTIVVNPSDTAAFNYSLMSYCQSDPDPSPTNTGTLGGTFTSSPAGLVINGGTGVIDLSASTPGTYGILYTTPGPNCQDTLTVFVTVTTTEDATFNYPNTTFCQNDPNPTANILGTPGGTFTSSPTGLVINGSTGLIDLALSNPGTYGILYTTPSSTCQDTLTVFITINPADDASFSYSSTTFCITDANPVATITGTAGGTFTVNNGGIINSITGELNINSSGVGTFTITYTTNGACPDTSSIVVTINNISNATITQAGPFCSTDATINLTSVDGGGNWSGNGITNTSNGTFDPTVAGAGIHQIIYTISGSCGDSDTIDIIVSLSPSISLTETDDNCFRAEGNIISLVNGGISPYSYLWSNGGTTPSISNLTSGTYSLTVTDSIGCTNTSIGIVNDQNNNCNYHVFLPNIFSPNGDSHNDIFKVRGEGIKALSFVIYSRWGEKVFETNDPDIGWNGDYKGEKMNAGVFVYYLKATMINNELIEKQGNVTLVR